MATITVIALILAVLLLGYLTFTFTAFSGEVLK